MFCFIVLIHSSLWFSNGIENIDEKDNSFLQIIFYTKVQMMLTRIDKGENDGKVSKNDLFEKFKVLGGILLKKIKADQSFIENLTRSHFNDLIENLEFHCNNISSCTYNIEFNNLIDKTIDVLTYYSAFATFMGFVLEESTKINLSNIQDFFYPINRHFKLQYSKKYANNVAFIPLDEITCIHIEYLTIHNIYGVKITNSSKVFVYDGKSINLKSTFNSNFRCYKHAFDFFRDILYDCAMFITTKDTDTNKIIEYTDKFTKDKKKIYEKMEEDLKLLICDIQKKTRKIGLDEGKYFYIKVCDTIEFELFLSFFYERKLYNNDSINLLRSFFIKIYKETLVIILNSIIYYERIVLIKNTSLRMDFQKFDLCHKAIHLIDTKEQLCRYQIECDEDKGKNSQALLSIKLYYNTDLAASNFLSAEFQTSHLCVYTIYYSQFGLF